MQKTFSNLFTLTLFLALFFLITPPILARTTPADILNSQKEAYSKKVSSYSPDNQAKLESLSGKIALINSQNTEKLNFLLERQAQILEEYDNRKGINETKVTSDTFASSTKQEQAHYWLTFAHEAVDYQSAKVYVFSLTSEANMKNDALNTISRLQADLNYAKGTVEKSQRIIADLVKGQ